LLAHSGTFKPHAGNLTNRAWKLRLRNASMNPPSHLLKLTNRLCQAFRIRKKTCMKTVMLLIRMSPTNPRALVALNPRTTLTKGSKTSEFICPWRFFLPKFFIFCFLLDFFFKSIISRQGKNSSSNCTPSFRSSDEPGDILHHRMTDQMYHDIQVLLKYRKK
jgi:hypothetical protein